MDVSANNAAARMIDQIRQKPVSQMTGRELALIYKNGKIRPDEARRLKAMIEAKKRQQQQSQQGGRALSQKQGESPAQQKQQAESRRVQQGQAPSDRQQKAAAASRPAGQSASQRQSQSSRQQQAQVQSLRVPPNPNRVFDSDDGDLSNLFPNGVSSTTVVPLPQSAVRPSVNPIQEAAALRQESRQEQQLRQEAQSQKIRLGAQSECRGLPNDDLDGDLFDFTDPSPVSHVRPGSLIADGSGAAAIDADGGYDTYDDEPKRNFEGNHGFLYRAWRVIVHVIHEPICVISIVLLLFVLLFMRAFYVPSGSMKPTLIEGDRIMSIAQYFPSGSTYQRGDIVCFTAPNGTVYVKRVIGIGGDRVQISGENVYVNGEESPYQGTGGVMTSMDIQLADDEYWVMGDNRANSEDSRFIGPVKADKMISKVIAIYQPFDHMTFL